MNSPSDTPYIIPVIPDSPTVVPPELTLPCPPLTTRGITAETCALFDTYSTGKPLEIVTAVIRDGQPIGYHYRADGWTQGRAKRTWWAPGSQRWLIGTQLYSGVPCPVYLSEGETDMMAIHQTLTDGGLSLCYGGNPDDTQLAEWVAYIKRVATVVYLCFDSDAAGQAYQQKFLKLYGSHEVYGLVLPPGFKDACELLMGGGTLQFERLPRLPSTVFTAQQVVERATQAELAEVLTTGIKPLDKLIGGYKPGKFVLISGVTKQGKSSFVVDLAVKYIRAHSKPVMFIPLELTMYETLAHFPVDCHPYLYFVQHFGATDEGFIAENIRACTQLGVSLVILDHLTAAGTSFTEGLQTSAIDALVYQLKALINELDLALIGVSHTNASCTGIVEANHLRGSAALVQVPSVTLGIRRLEDNVMELRSVTADRDTGVLGRINFLYERGSGFTFYEHTLGAAL